MEGDEPTTNYYPDVRTLYELFLRGLRESSEFPPFFTSMLTPIHRCDFRINLGFILSLSQITGLASEPENRTSRMSGSLIKRQAHAHVHFLA